MDDRNTASAGAAEEYLLETRNVKMHFPIKAGVLRRTVGHVKAVDGVDLKLRKGETLGLVGESGCGKSTLARLILRLLEPTEGEVLFEGENVLDYDRRQMLMVRKNMQIIFQDPYASLNPRMTVGNIIAEPLNTHGSTYSTYSTYSTHSTHSAHDSQSSTQSSRGEAGGLGERKRQYKKRVQELLEMVGLSPEHYNRYPHEFSGGQRQRIGVARAIALNPKLIICDEPVSALDVSIQAQIINLLENIQKELDLTYVFIAHDLSVVKHICDRVAVMYLGKIVESASREDLYKRPRHPYTNSLLSAIPTPDPHRERERTRIVLGGDVPSPASPPPGCHFHPRCPRAQEYCKENVPPLDLQHPRGGSEGIDQKSQSSEEHRAACFFPVIEGQKVEETVSREPYRAE